MAKFMVGMTRTTWCEVEVEAQHELDAANRAEWDDEQVAYAEEEVISVVYLCGEVQMPKPCPIKHVQVRAPTLEEVAEFEAEKRAAQQTLRSGLW